jgi:hypothetical protein
MFVSQEISYRFLTVYMSLILLIIKTTLSIEIMFAEFSNPSGLASTALAVLPSCEIAVEELNRRYNNSGMNFTYTITGARGCLTNMNNNDGIVAKWYYAQQKPGRIIVFTTTGSEQGNIFEHI